MPASLVGLSFSQAVSWSIFIQSSDGSGSPQKGASMSSCSLLPPSDAGELIPGPGAC